MNLRQLELYVAVVEAGSFSRGAEAALLTQSTVSQHIAALESEVELQLLERTAQGAVVTHAGKLFLQHARKVLAEFGLTLPDDTTLRIHDSTADMRYIVLPARPSGTGGWSKENLADLVTRDSMIGVGVPKSPA